MSVLLCCTQSLTPSNPTSIYPNSLSLSVLPPSSLSPFLFPSICPSLDHPTTVYYPYWNRWPRVFIW